MKPSLALFSAMLFVLFTSLTVAAPIGWETVINQTDDLSCTGWGGGNCNSTNGQYYTTGSWSTWTKDWGATSYNHTRFCYMSVSGASLTNHKIGDHEASGGFSNVHLLSDNSAGNFRQRPEGGYSPEYSGSYGTNRVCLVFEGTINLATGNFSLYWNDVYRWSRTDQTLNVSKGDQVRFETGDLGGSSIFAIDNMTFEFYNYNEASTCTYSGSGNWTILKSDNCTITTAVDLKNNTLIFNGTGVGYTIINALINNVTALRWSDTPTVEIWWNGSIRKLT